MSGDLHLRKESDYDAGTATLRDQWQVRLDDYPITPLADRMDVQRRLRRFAEEALRLADSLETQ
jgi:hypothetical protein